MFVLRFDKGVAAYDAAFKFHFPEDYSCVIGILMLKLFYLREPMPLSVALSVVRILGRPMRPLISLRM